MHEADDSVPEAVIGPPSPSGADFFLPQRGAKSLDAAQVAISHGPAVDGPGNGSGHAAACPAGTSGHRP
jgi:hypothetical protein